MAAIDKSQTALRIIGDDLDPDEISRILGKAPTNAERKGHVIRSQSRGRERTAMTGGWRLRAENCCPEDVNGQVAQILSGMTADTDIWRELTSKYRVDMFCGLFMRVSNEGLALSPDTMLELGRRGIKIDFDIYAPFTEKAAD